MSKIVRCHGIEAIAELFSDDKIICELVKSGNIEGLKKVLNTPDFVFTQHNTFSDARSEEMRNYLLSDVIDANLLTNYANRGAISKFISKGVLKNKINPNSIDNYGYVTWHIMLTRLEPNEQNEFLKYATSEASKNNFTEALDINAVDQNGNTFLHSYTGIDAVLVYKPNPWIKNKQGVTALEYRVSKVQNSVKLNEYVASYVHVREDVDKDARIKELEDQLAKIKAALNE